jgi:hypothetical protein
VTNVLAYNLQEFITSVDRFIVQAGNTKGGSITVPLTFCLTCLDKPVLKIKTKIVSSLTADSKPVKQEVNRTVILPPLVFPGSGHRFPFFDQNLTNCLSMDNVFFSTPNLKGLARFLIPFSVMKSWNSNCGSLSRSATGIKNSPT